MPKAKGRRMRRIEISISCELRVECSAWGSLRRRGSKRIAQIRQTVDRRREHQTARLQDARGLLHRLLAVRYVAQVIQRTQQQHGCASARVQELQVRRRCVLDSQDLVSQSGRARSV